MRWKPSDILLIDATNILSRAAIDAKRCSDVSMGVSGGNRKQQNSEDYLRRRRRRRRQKDLHTSGPSPNSNAGKLKPFIETIESIDGGIALLSGGGYEADECIGAVCALFKDANFLSAQRQNAITTTTTTGKGSSPLSIIIASGDSDMQQFLTPTISWLHIASLPTLIAPSALSIVTETSFYSKNKFPPSAYANYLALVGKKEASIGGVGIGSSLAAKLLKQFHSIEGIEQAAQQGSLQGWPPAVDAVFLNKNEASSAAVSTQLERNREIFSSITNPEAVLTSAQREKLLAQAAARFFSIPSRSREEGRALVAATAPSSGLGLVWHHPLHAIRWLQAGPLAQNLAQIFKLRNLGPCELQAATAKGLPIDLLIINEGGGGGGGKGSVDGGVAVMVCAPCDFTISNSTESKAAKAPQESIENAEHLLKSIIDDIENASRGGGRLEGGVTDPCHVGKKLNRAVQHHISLLKKAGVAPVLIPWWILQPTETSMH
ncbi:hypothetical protein KSW81_006402 [Nannochloris sp. 'desiccata']|nr:hypothetical protein KSW81_006402 [Chlorella desiccata (nom. nud.)]